MCVCVVNISDQVKHLMYSNCLCILSLIMSLGENKGMLQVEMLKIQKMTPVISCLHVDCYYNQVYSNSIYIFSYVIESTHYICLCIIMYDLFSFKNA